MSKFKFFKNSAIGYIKTDHHQEVIFYSIVSEWFDGSLMNDEKLDPYNIYIKNDLTNTYYKRNISNSNSVIEFTSRLSISKISDLDLYLFKIQHLNKCIVIENGIIYNYRWKDSSATLNIYDIPVRNGSFSLIDKPLVNIKKFGAKPNVRIDNIQSINESIKYASKNGMDVLIDSEYFIKPSSNSFIICQSGVNILGINYSVSKVSIIGNSIFNTAISNGKTICSNVKIENILFENNDLSRKVEINGKSNREQIISMYSFDNIKVKNCSFISGSINMLNFNSSKSGNVNISDCKFIFQHNRNNKNYYDNSVIYSENKSAEISHNVFDVSSESIGFGTCAIELHGDNQIAKKNLIINFNVGVNLCSGFDRYNSNIGNCFVQDNEMRNVNNGVHIWIFKNALNNIKISGNKILINQFQFTKAKDPTAIFATTGIRLVYPKIVENRKNQINNNWTITNNIISFQKESIGNKVNRVYLSGGINFPYFSSLRNILISNNKILNSPTTAIRVVQNGKHNFLDNFKILNNDIENSGLNILAPLSERIIIEVIGGLNGIVSNNVINNMIKGSSNSSYKIKGLKIHLDDNITKVPNLEIRNVEVN